jgi:hypothetical protein
MNEAERPDGTHAGDHEETMGPESASSDVMSDETAHGQSDVMSNEDDGERD